MAERPEAEAGANHQPRFEQFSRRLVAESPVQVVVMRQVDSTNRLARTIVRELAAETPLRQPLALFAWHQVAGRGRLGRTWHSDPGQGVCLSLFWPLEDTGPSSLQGLPLRVGTALQRALSSCGLDVQLKWPNDLLVGRRKLGGVLLELLRGPNDGLAPGVVIGIGINVAQGADEIFSGATSLAIELGGSHARAHEVGLRCLQSVCEELRTPRGLAEIVAQYRERSAHRIGDVIAWRSPAGERRGRFGGIDPQGALLLETEDGIETVQAGEVVLGEEPGPG